ncbi:MAG TPA: DUF488 domain-containing protein [Acidimicrobiales bacterium]
MTLTVHTLGHGTLPAEDLVALLDDAAVERLADVRSFPGSRHNPQFGREAMAEWVPEAGHPYVWLPKLGGRRRKVPDSKHIALRNDSFRAYADHMETDEFAKGVEELLALAAEAPIAVMCSESVWWRCHRRLLADHLIGVRGVDVVHLMHDGRHTPHSLTDGARVADGTVIYDVGVTPPLLSED